MSLLQEIKEMLSTWRATAVLLLLLAAAMAAATFLEAGLGTEAARGVVYHAWWFFVLYGLLIANFVLVSHRYGLWRRKQWGLLLLHYGFAVILGGAAITHLWGYEGMMHIRTGQSWTGFLPQTGRCTNCRSALRCATSGWCAIPVPTHPPLTKATSRSTKGTLRATYASI